MKFNLRLLYLYLFSFVGLIVTVIGTVKIIDLGLKVFVFKEADVMVTYPRPVFPPDGKNPDTDPVALESYQKEEMKRQRQREAANALSMILVGTPLYLYHWKTIKKENKSKR